LVLGNTGGRQFQPVTKCYGFACVLLFKKALFGFGDHEAKFWLNCPGGPVALWENEGFYLRELNEIADELERSLAKCCEKWRQIHGDY
jgi:hypothetical protein